MALLADDVFDALGDPTRRAIMDLLQAGPLPVGKLAEQLPVSRPAVSHHLRVLKRAALVTEAAVGTRRLYRIDQAGLQAVREHLDLVWAAALSEFAVLAEREPTQPTPAKPAHDASERPQVSDA